MKRSESVKPIRCLKAHASGLIREVGDKSQTYVITLNGEARAVVQGIVEYERTQESLALLKILARGRSSIDEGKVKPAEKRR